MLTEGGALSGSQGSKFLRVTLSRFTPPVQLITCDALIDLVATEIASYLTPENVVGELFCDPPPCAPSPYPAHYGTDN